jgi:DNA-binding NarL/FixJ family response regulator
VEIAHLRSSASCIATACALGENARLRCLIVDDSEGFLASASSLLESQGLEIVARASSRDEALELAEALEPDVALIDIVLGDEDGVALTRQLAARVPATRIILISSYGRDDLGELLTGSPAVGFIPKSALGAKAIARLLG